MATAAPRSIGDDSTPLAPGKVPVAPGAARPLTPGWRWVVGATAFYLAALTVATWPAIPNLATGLPSRVDPLAHLWTMRWNKACLLAGKLPFRCPDIQYPVGAALGTLPPMHFQTLLYVPLSMVFANDVLCYNLIRTVAFLLTGVGTMLLIWNVVGDRRAAVLGGMLAMLGEPILFFSQAELEQITVGWFPIFLIAWLRWVDRPTGRGLAAAAATYILLAMSAPYFGVFAVFPAALYVAWRWGAAWRAGLGGWTWLRDRLGWFAGFVAIAGPAVVVLFANQVWALRHGFTLHRPDAEFSICRVPGWSYLVPTPIHRLSRILPFSTYVMGEVGAVPAYLGVVTLALIVYAAVARVPFARRGYWWAVFLMLVTLSLGAHGWFLGHDVSLPAAWLKKYFIGFRMIRVPARFCLFAGVGGAVVAAAGLAHLLSRIKAPRARDAVFGLLTLAALLDLTIAPYGTVEVPAMPACYEFIRRQDPHATITDAPFFNDGAFVLPALATYWQSFHGLRTTAGYTAFNNARETNLIGHTSPFAAQRLADPGYLAHPEAEHFELAGAQDFRSYVWLYLTVHDIRFVVIHRQAAAFPEFPVHLGRTIELLADAVVFADARTVVVDRAKLPPPTRPTFLYDEGWGHRVARGRAMTVQVDRRARIWAYAPAGSPPWTLTLDAAGHKAPRRVGLAADGIPLAAWHLPATAPDRVASPPFDLAPGLHELTLTTDGDAPPSRADAHVEGDKTPFGLWVTALGLGPANDAALAGRTVGERVVR